MITTLFTIVSPLILLGYAVWLVIEITWGKEVAEDTDALFANDNTQISRKSTKRQTPTKAILRKA